MTDRRAHHRSSHRISGGRVVLVVFGALAALVGVVLSIGGGALLWAHATERDSNGFYTTDTERFTTATYALISNIDLGRAPGEHDWTLRHPVGTLRVRATSEDGSALFVGIAAQRDVERWLAGVAHERVRGANFGPFHTDSRVIDGDRAPTPPGRETFWAATATGGGTQTVFWPSESGRWTIVVMNADAHRGVDADVEVGARTSILLPIGVGLLVTSVAFLGGATTMLFFGLRHQVSAGASPTPLGTGSVPGAYPARLDGHLDPHMSRWLWLVKWVLVIPHVVVLAFLWLAMIVLTVVAGFTILFTTRYPRSIFAFNVGVMRWTWRVSFYGLSALATDKYPPFTLRSDPTYPADFDVDYPERLSRGLVLVKWWLLALPHYLLVALFAGGWHLVGGTGLIALLAIIAGVILLFRNRYPDSIFDFLMGLNRWCYRVFAYAALMTDEYPPFRLDGGGLDPGSVPSGLQPNPTNPDGRDHSLVGSST